MNGEPVDIEVRLPLPLDVSGTLMTLVGLAYPGTMVQMNGRPGTMTLRVPDADRRGKPIPKRKAKAARVEASPEETEASLVDFTERDGEQVLTVSTPEEAMEQLAYWAHLMLQVDGAVNYVEQEVTSPDSGRFVIVAARSAGQTPHQLRQAADKRYDDLVARLRELRAEDEWPCPDCNGTGADNAASEAAMAWTPCPSCDGTDGYGIAVALDAIIPPETPAAPGPGER